MNAKMIIVWTGCAALASVAAADTFLNRAAFNAQFPGLSLQDFESATDTQSDYGDFVLTSLTGGGVGTTESGFPSRVAIAGLADDPLTMTFTIPIEAVGFQVAAIGFFDQLPLRAEVRAIDPQGNVLETITLMTGGRAMTSFIGFGNVGEIGRVRISAMPLEAAFLAIDDVAYGIPSPASIAVLAGLGLVPLRRRQR